MTHTLHPEIEEAIYSLAHFCEGEPAESIKFAVYKYLGKYLLPPSQHLKDDEPLTEKPQYGYDPEANIPDPYELMEQMGASISKKIEEELKQSTPKIEKIDSMSFYHGTFVSKLNEVIDYINNKDLPSKQ